MSKFTDRRWHEGQSQDEASLATDDLLIEDGES